MAIGPMDIHHKEFSTVRMGGYNKEEVDSFLDMVADELDRLLHRNQEQAELVESMRQKAGQFDSMQQTLQNALINAQKSADNIVQEAKSQADAQIKEAREQSLRILEEAQSERSRISQSFESVREQVHRYMATMRELLENNQAMIKEYEARLAAEELREQPAPAAPAHAPGRAQMPETSAPLISHEPTPSVESVPEFRGQEAFEEAAAMVPEPAPMPVEPEPSFMASEETPPPQHQAAEPAYEMPPEASPAEREPGEKQAGFEEYAPASRPVEEAPPPPPKYTPEQEMEFMRESLAGESPQAAPSGPAPAPPEPAPEPTPRPYAPESPPEPAAEPAREPENGAGEKHFFWE